MSANYWHVPVTGNFGFRFDHPLRVPQRPIREERRRTQLNAYLQTQFELSQPGSGLDPYEQRNFNGVTQSSVLHGILSLALQYFRGRAVFVSKLLISCLFRMVYYGLKLPFNIICAFALSIDWWLVFAFSFAVMLSPMTSTKSFGNEDRTVMLAVEQEYELVRDFRRWGMIKITACVFRSGLLTYIAVYSCFRISP